jgi:hypothetical protein
MCARPLCCIVSVGGCVRVWGEGLPRRGVFDMGLAVAWRRFAGPLREHGQEVALLVAPTATATPWRIWMWLDGSRLSKHRAPHTVRLTSTSAHEGARALHDRAREPCHSDQLRRRRDAGRPQHRLGNPPVGAKGQTRLLRPDERRIVQVERGW